MKKVRYLTGYGNIKKESVKRARRRRQCFVCHGWIQKQYPYLNREIRYDDRILTLNYHLECSNH